MAVLEHLEPKRVFYYLEEISAIPRGSGNTKAISDYLVDFAKKRGLAYYQDTLNNVILYAPATAGYESADTVIVQGHMDMVCLKEENCGKDLEKEGLDLAVGENCVYAKGTTLGADDGIAVAMGLALLESEEIPHPPLELVITVDEETGMTGAVGLDISRLKGTRLLNLDSEEEYVLTAACAGDLIVHCEFPLQYREESAAEGVQIRISGLLGGHSGTDIHTGRANANNLMGRLLQQIQKEQPACLVGLSGGEKENAICSSAQALLCVADRERVQQICRELETTLRIEYAGCDENIRIQAETVPVGQAPLREDCSRRIITLLCAAPAGVQAMSARIPGLVQTSLNMSILRMYKDAEICSGLLQSADCLEVCFSVRSSIDSQKHRVADQLRCLAEAVGASVWHSGEYPGWDFSPVSPLRELLTEVYVELFGKAPRVQALHAGVECGIFVGKRPGLDCVSFGPQIDEIHTPRERLYIDSTARTWALLKETLRRMK